MKDKIEDYEYKHKIKDSELVEIGANLAHVSQEEFDFFEERRSVYADFKERADSFKERRKRLTEEYNSGYRKEIIKVRAEPHPESGEAWLYKAGTNIRMGSRPITEDERQGTLKFDALIEPSKNEDTKAVLKKSKKSSAENVAGFFASDEGEKEAADDGDENHYGPNGDGTTPGFFHQNEETGVTAEIGEIESGGETFPKKSITETKIKFPDELYFGAAIKVVGQPGDFHYGWRISSTKSPKAGDAISVYVDGVIYTDYAAMVEQAGRAMIHALVTNPRFKTMAGERVSQITKIIEDFCAPERAEAVAAD